ncbi:22528_t:CDS:1, partial [Gigaspora margarita]
MTELASESSESLLYKSTDSRPHITDKKTVQTILQVNKDQVPTTENHEPSPAKQ